MFFYFSSLLHADDVRAMRIYCDICAHADWPPADQYLLILTTSICSRPEYLKGYCNFADSNLSQKQKCHNVFSITGVCGGIYYEGIYMVKVILAEIYMLEHFLWSFFVTECHNYDQIDQGIQKFSKIWSSWLITKDIHVLHGLFRRSEWKLLKESVGKRSPIYGAFYP